MLCWCHTPPLSFIAGDAWQNSRFVIIWNRCYFGLFFLNGCCSSQNSLCACLVRPFVISGCHQQPPNNHPRAISNCQYDTQNPLIVVMVTPRMLWESLWWIAEGVTCSKFFILLFFSAGLGGIQTKKIKHKTEHKL